MKKVVVVAPTFNEAENITAFIAAVSKFNVDVLISDSHSTDATAQLVKKFRSKRVHYLDVKKRGLGLGLSAGLDYAVNKLKADYLVTMEADLSCDPKLLPKFIAGLKNYDVVIGSRYAPGGGVENWSWWRKLLSLGANFVLRCLLLFPKLHEFTNLYRAFRKEVWLGLRSEVSVHRGWLFVPAFAFEVVSSKFKFTELPFVYFDRFGGRSKMRTLSYTKNLLHYALRYTLKKYV
ncbi:MAG: glycosyltransferase [Patescibacteria group bacterium]|nr:glycosyltransferase [Patescibacteria group bacterium]MCL5431534.1 glycosyltransferase [Patescibacteria group bacterium]